MKYSAIKCYTLPLLSLASRSKGLLGGGEEYKTGTDTFQRTTKHVTEGIRSLYRG